MLSIPIASYCSIKRLVLENLPSLKFAPLINLIGIIPNGSIINSTCPPLREKNRLAETCTLKWSGYKYLRFLTGSKTQEEYITSVSLLIVKRVVKRS
ncbi:hypothetical protein ESZ39_17145 [Colwellia sp. C1TZA3]|nr:hypothetical protein ESZ39_17145 [Colwellia sp. C1TZA3]